ncbi:AMP-binding enzyme family protein [Mycobacterium ulcerans str. Harvey]|uniref:AMP-binding enzyme family protein n=1 Tax=Mycobacterium ulcerans str. Harvey TaxID=1299332 RepID=A0ABP3AIV9_MYCUL|nr:AMP-binding enzyme family protein [Mycobacterium ulcerans str. Harvey]
MLREGASLRPSETAFTFIDYERDWAGIAETLTWSQLHRRTCNVVRELKACGATGDRAVVLAPQGLDYIVAFLGALQAGQIAVPLSAPLGGPATSALVRCCATRCPRPFSPRPRSPATSPSASR